MQSPDSLKGKDLKTVQKQSSWPSKSAIKNPELRTFRPQVFSSKEYEHESVCHTVAGQNFLALEKFQDSVGRRDSWLPKDKAGVNNEERKQEHHKQNFKIYEPYVSYVQIMQIY